jgi:hypothetical protein
VHYAFKQELQLLSNIIRDYTDDTYDYDPVEGTRQAKKSDYDMVEIIPVSDPNAATMSQRVVQYQAVIQLSQTAPQIYNLPELHRQMLEVLGIKNAAKLVPVEDDQKPTDPVTENMEVIKGKPVKAFIYQDHDAHIAVHTAALQDPQMAALMGQNPKAQMMFAAMQAHIAEHAGFAYRRQIEEQLGIPLPSPEDEMPKELELQVSRLTAEAAKRVLANNQAKAAQQQAQQQAQDPLVQMQQQELALKQAEIQRKAQKDMVDAQTKQAELAIKEKELIVNATAKVDEMELKNRELLARTAQAVDELSLKGELEGMKLGTSVAQSRAQMRQQNNKPQGGNTQ